jgi:hypothetical protein
MNNLEPITYNKKEPAWWMKAVLLTGSIYSIVWGILIISMPHLLYVSNHLDSPNYIFLWKTLGGLEIILGIGLFIASQHAFRNWAMVLIVLLYKVLATGIYFNSAFDDEKLYTLTNYIFIDNIIWVLPFAIILWRSYQYYISGDDYELDYFGSEQFTLDMFETSEGLTIHEMSHKWPTLTVFLRHFGCTFCREAMQDIAEQRDDIERNGTRILIVHMLENEDEAYEQMKKYGLEDLPTVSDPEKLLYKKFQLRQGNLFQVFGLKVLYRGMYKGLVKGLGLGAPMGDTIQMPGVFLLYKGKTVKSFMHQSAADRPEYVKLAQCGECV